MRLLTQGAALGYVIVGLSARILPPYYFLPDSNVLISILTKNIQTKEARPKRMNVSGAPCLFSFNTKLLD